MISFVMRRIISIIPVMLLVATGVFLLLKLTPGDPVGVMLGPDASEERREALRDDLGLTDRMLSGRRSEPATAIRSGSAVAERPDSLHPLDGQPVVDPDASVIIER